VIQNLPGLFEGLGGMRAGGVRKVFLPPAHVSEIWGHDGIEDLRGKPLVLGQFLFPVSPSL
jgi:hypothetical protein